MKLCIINSFYPLIKGGAEYQAKILASYLKEKYDVFFISYGHSEEGVEYIDGFKVYKIALSRKVDSISLYKFSGNKIKSILSSENPDVIYQRILNSYSFHIANYVTRSKKKVKYILHIADNYSLEFHTSVRGIVKYILFRRLVTLINKRDTNIHVLVQTDQQKKMLQAYKVYDVFVINNIHPVEYEDVVDKSNIEKLTIVWIGSSRAVKRLELYLNLAFDLRKNKHIEFHLIGRIEGSNRYQEKILRHISICNIHYHGEQTNSYINDFLYKNADILINTSSSEGFSNTFIQAWLTGVYVISLNSNPNNVFTDNMFLGLFCNNDYELLREAVSSFSKSYDQSLLARRYAINQFSIEVIGPKFLKIL